MELNVPIDNNKCYRAILAILNFSTNMTETELDVIATMFIHNMKILTKESRAELLVLLNKDKFTLNNHIKRLREKRILVDGGNKQLILNKGLVNTIEQSIEDKEIKLTLDYVS